MAQPETITGNSVQGIEPVPGHPTDSFTVEDQAASSAPHTAEDESQYPTGTRFYLILLCVGLVLVLSGIDTSIVSVAVPTITDHFHTVADVGWYSASFRLCACSFQFMFGKLYKVFPIKTVFLASVVITMFGSALCAAAPSSAVFVLGRAVNGFACAGIISGCFTLLAYLLPLRKRPLYTGIMGAVELLAIIAAPILGGAIVEGLGWRWCFWIALPIGGVTLAGIYFFLGDIKQQQSLTWRETLSQLDLLGNVVFIPSLTCLFMALSWGGARYPWNSPTIIGLFVTFAVLLVIFAWDQRRKGDSATLPPRILRNRSVLAGFIFSLSCNSAVNVIEYYLPTYFQAIREYSPGKSGYLMLPVVLGSMIGMLAHGSGVSLAGYYAPFMLAGSVLMPVFSGLMTTLTVDMDLDRILCYSGFYGFATGIGFQGSQSAVQTVLPTSDTSIGIAIIMFAQQFGPAVFVSAAQSIFVNRLSENLHELAPGINATSIEAMGLSDLKAHIGIENLRNVLLGFDRSLIETWYLAVALASMTLIGSATIEWRSVKHKKS